MTKMTSFAPAIERACLGADALCKLYAAEVKWSLGQRVSRDSQLLLLVLNRLIRNSNLSLADRRSLAVYVAARTGGQENYATFDTALASGDLRPMAYAYALPSIPLACASLLLSLTGPTYSFLGGATVGLDAARQAATAVRLGTTPQAIVVTTACPPTSESSTYQAVALHVNDSVAQVLDHGFGADSEPALSQCPVACFEDYLGRLFGPAAQCGFRSPKRRERT